MWQTLASICCTYLVMYYSPAYFEVWIFDNHEDNLDSKWLSFAHVLWLANKSCSIFSTNQEENQNQSMIGDTRVLPRFFQFWLVHLKIICPCCDYLN